jgi:iron complex transport system ATP-binding protein
MRLRVNGIDFAYNKIKVLREISFNQKKSEIIGIIGPNGAGKSTLIKCLDRILKVSQGTIGFEDQNLEEMKLRDIARNICYVPQHHDSHFSLSVFDTVLMGRRPFSQTSYSNKDKEKVLEAIKELKLEKFLNRNYNELSGGEKQKVILSRAIAQNGKLMLMDEPTSNLDIKYQKEVMEFLKNHASVKEISVIIAIHDINLAATYCDKLIMMKKGRIHYIGPPSEVLTQENIQEIFDVKVDIIKKDNKLIISYF